VLTALEKHSLGEIETLLNLSKFAPHSIQLIQNCHLRIVE
jgi:hypothetical protein